MFWLTFANAVGVLIAQLLIFPQLNGLLGEWTYGRWMPVHIDLQLYGWCSLPLVAFLFSVYGADRSAAAPWARPALWLWSTTLAVGTVAWLNGVSSGKLFLDWSGYTRVLFPLALLGLWGVLAWSLADTWHNNSLAAKLTKLLGLAFLLAVPELIYIASAPSLYPPINPDTGGPTGASQLESTLVIIAVLLLLPFGLAARRANTRSILFLTWLVFAAESVICLGLGRADVSHHRPVQWISLGSLLTWLPLTPLYYNAFAWRANTRIWRIAFLCWWSVLVPTGWCLFLPGMLDRFKFTDGLVGHSLLAMAGFVSSLLVFVMVQLLGEGGWIFNRVWSFWLWQVCVIFYVASMLLAGWHEGADPSFTMVPGALRTFVYTLRLLLGGGMLVASVEWLLAGSALLRGLAAQKEADA
jgi:cytochrome c oxidase cbb3-type subunit 1